VALTHRVCELAPCAELLDDVHASLIFIHLFELSYIQAASQHLENLDFPPDGLKMFLYFLVVHSSFRALGDAFASEHSPRLQVCNS
jgi:hypothetical protein